MSIKVTSNIKYFLAVITVLYAGFGNAARIENSDTGLAAWDTLLEFDEVGGLTQGDAVTNQYQAYGVTFDGLLFTPFGSAVGWVPDGSYGYYGFTDIEFDKIEMAAVTPGAEIDFILIDNLQFSAVPVPAAFWLFGAALLGFIGFSRKTTV
jgi:hypothetical protein